MTEIRPLVMPRTIPTLLGFVAGYIDSITFLGLFGIFVAQLTGSYVLAGTNFVANEHGITVKLLAIPVFFSAGCIATAVAMIAGARSWRPLPCVMGLECVLLSAFTAIVLLRPLSEIDAPVVRSAALLALAAMGVQSAMVRLLMRGVASTNVMTTNTTQIAVDFTMVLLSWFSTSIAHESSRGNAARERLSMTFPIMAAFLFGTVFGGLAFSVAGFATMLLPLAIAYFLLGWMIWQLRDPTVSPFQG